MSVRDASATLVSRLSGYGACSRSSSAIRAAYARYMRRASPCRPAASSSRTSARWARSSYGSLASSRSR